MNKKVIIVGIILLVVAGYFFLSKNGGLGQLTKGTQTETEQSGKDKDDAAKVAADGKTKEDGASGAAFDDKTTDSSKTTEAEKKKLKTEISQYAKKGKVTLSPEIKKANQTDILSKIDGLRLNMTKNECFDLIKTRKGSDFTCRLKGDKSSLGTRVLYEASYKDGVLTHFNSKVQGINEIVGLEHKVSKRESKGKKKPRKTKSRAASALKFSLEGRDFLELYLDENYMAEQLEYHYYDFKQAILTDEFYKERDFQERLETVILSINRSMKSINRQCKNFQYKKACVAYKKYQKINLREDAKKIIARAESAKIESAFFD